MASFVDPASGLRFELHTPQGSPDRWRAYLDGAEARYRAHGVFRALNRPKIDDGKTTSLFFVAVDDTDQVAAGIRCLGPLEDESGACALSELEGHPQLQILRDQLSERVAAGVVELKGAWVQAHHPRPGLSDALARCYVHAMTWFDAQFALCSCAVETAPRWQSTGSRPLAGFEPFGYPDDRYRTILLWWDRAQVEELSDPVQWVRLQAEQDLILAQRPPLVDAPIDEEPSADQAVPATEAWRPEVLDDRLPADRLRLAELLARTDIEVVDHFAEQLAGLRKVSARAQGTLDREALDRGAAECRALDREPPRWIYYPWRRTVVKLLGPAAFRVLRLDRNRNKITRAEQEVLEQRRIGVVGLSVGHSIAHTLALEGICGELRLADFDHLELSNLNRIPATLLDLGVNKAVAVARRIAELDPYLHLTIFTDGLTASNMDHFVDGLDVVIEECDSLDLKLSVREAARGARIPLIMETSDRGLLDIERFDLEPERPLFHGLLGNVRASDLVGLSTHDKVPYVLRILEPAKLSSRMAASMAEIDETLSTWPQLGGDVTLGAATVAAAVRRLGRGEYLPSGRVRVDVDAALDALTEPEPSDPGGFEVPVVLPPPADAYLAVAHAAGLAPSGGNSQPWSFQLQGGEMRVYLDRNLTSTMDIRYRGSYVAIGAALLNARIAASALGVDGTLEVFPDGDGSDLVAALHFGRDRDDELAAHYPGVLDRSTNRRAGRPTPLGGALADDLRDQVARAGGRLCLLSHDDEIEQYAELLGESDRLRYLSPVLHRELMSELRWPGTDTLERGIDVRTLELDDADLSKLSVARRSDVMADLAAWDGGRALGQVTRDRVRSSSALAVVTIPDSSVRAYVAGGEAVERLWLAAERGGLAVQPVSMLSVFAIDAEDFTGLVPDAYVARLQGLATRLRALAGMTEGEALALVLRLSHAEPPSTRSLRIPLPTVLLR